MDTISVKLTMNEDVSKKFSKISSSGKTLVSELSKLGKAVDEAFKSTSLESFSSKVDTAATSATARFRSVGDAVDDAFDVSNWDISWMDNIGDKSEEAASDIAKLSRRVEELEKELSQLGREDGLGNFADKADDAADSISRVDSKAGSLTGTIRGLVAAVGSYIALDTIKDFGLSTLDSAANQQAMESQFSQVFGNLEGTAESSLGQIANNTGILENRLKGSYTQIAAFAKTSGMDTADALELSNRAMIAVADSAAFYDKSLEEVTESLQSYLKGNYENDAALGLSSTEYTRNAAAMELYGEKFQDLSESQKQLTLLQMVEDANELSGALGQAARESETWTNQTGNLQQAWTDMKAELGENILDESVETVGVLIDSMDTIQEPLEELFSTIGDVIRDLIPMLPGAITTFSNGLKSLGNVLGPLFNIVRENPDAVGKALFSIGTTVATYKVGTQLSDWTGGLSNIWSFISGHPWIAGATAVVGAVTAIGSAIDYYNDLEIEKDLADHFGNVELSAAQADEFASRVLDTEYLVDVNFALGKFENADKLAEEAESILAENDALEWKCSVGIELTPDEQQAYQDNVSTFIDNKIEEIESRMYAANISVSTMLTSPEGQNFADAIESWAAEDQIQVTELSAQLSALVENALTDGMIDVNEQAAIDILQSKINSILSGWKSSEAEAEMDLIEQEYGRLSGKDLTADSFSEVVNALVEQRETASEALDANSKEFYEVINGLTNSGRLTEDENEYWKEQWSQAVRNQEATDLTRSLDFESNTLSDTYGTEISEGLNAIGDNTSDRLSNMRSYFEMGDFQALQDSFNFANVTANEGSALEEIYSAMEPDTKAMGELIDEYVSLGQAVPKEVMDGFNEAMEIGAASGDEDAAWQVFANQMVADPANSALIQAIDEGTVGTPEELRTALERATAEVTDEPINMGDLTAEVGKVTYDQEAVDELLANARELAGLSATGEGMTIDGELWVEYEVTSGQTLSEIASEAGVAMDELLGANPSIENPDVITVGQEIYIPASAVEVDASEAGEAAQQQAQEQLAQEPIETETSAKVKVTAGETEFDSQAAKESASQAGNAAAEGMYESSGAASEAATELGSQAMNALETELTNTGGIYSAAGQLGNTVASAINASSGAATAAAASLGSSVLSTLRLSLSAGVAINIPVSVSATASGSFNVGGGLGNGVVPHAVGGIFDEPHIGIVAEAGPEAIIPLDGSDNAIGLWQDAGNRLGMFEDLSLPAAPRLSDGGGSSEYTENHSEDRTISINLNGSGRIDVSGVSREEVVDILMENMRDILLDIVSDELLEEGDLSHVY